MSAMRTIIGAALLMGAAAPVTAQSLFSTRGLGVPVRPVDARTAALGGIGVGMIGFHTSMTNPAEMAGVTRRGVSAAVQPVSSSFDVDGAQDGVSGTRFPLLSVLYPLSPRLVASIGYGSYLEQSWGVHTESTVMIGDRTYEVRDVLRSTGGIAQARIGAAYTLTPTLAVGAAVGLLTGSVERTAGRAFIGAEGSGFNLLTDTYRWSYQAPVATVGMRLDIAGRVRVGASAMAGGELQARAQTDDAVDREYGAPLELSAGASARLSSLLVANGGAVWSRVPSISDEVIARETVRFGAGLEYQGIRNGQRTFPLRLGAHRAELPYHLAGEEAATEWGVGVGFGFRIGDPVDPAAVADIGIERGGRSGFGGGAVDGGLSESLWRFNISLALFAR
ncbi:hypothetical protein BH23GEM10_BH23GEM10_16410 [soil metagenome]